MKFIYADSLDFVDPRYDFLADRSPTDREPQWDDEYPHEILGYAPYSGLLVSHAIVMRGKYTLPQAMRFRLVGAREFLRFTEKKFPGTWVIGDSGAFSYHRDTEPPISVEDMTEFYGEAGFTHGCSVDHVIFEFDESVVGMAGGTEESRRRFEITIENARRFLASTKSLGPGFTPMGVVQGWSPDSMGCAAQKLEAMGYTYLALGGMAPLKSDAIHRCLDAIRGQIKPSTRIHVLGFAKADNIFEFQRHNITSFDTTSPLLRAFKDQKSNYYLPAGDEKLKYFTAIRIPQALENLTLGRLVKSGRITQEELLALEREALDTLRRFDRGQADIEGTLDAVTRYSEVLLMSPHADDASASEKKLFDIRSRYRQTLESKPWKDCRCAICREISIEVIIFRSSNRNKRRGIHNLHVFYNHVKGLEKADTYDEQASLFCS
ncbi:MULTISPECIES: tRNA-guanine transglycosylase DpdA [Bradyrhizobium]|uniref:tRNA-guanine transglycosylase DpdA n=1 Tax=Bradyrhizobium TaxID=374 RepID=UPI000D128064|nr:MULTISPECIES: tRNA-guanine transglycosylase DpdA [Bradyrhizobium]PSO19519.1 hypothetical protein C7G42_14815 [Bradyrhizobium sp. MOS003]QDP22731.1 hypothetical protein FNV92_11435 [Bradyrhizobium cosmicum]